jgi:hypothetical protein
MGFKIGIHGAGVGSYDGYGHYRDALAAAGKPITVFCVDAAGPVWEIQNLGRPFDVLGFRIHAHETLPYSGDPWAFAQQRFNETVAAWPPELDPAIVWTTTENEPSKEASEEEWLAQYVHSMGMLMADAGRRYAALGWSAGTPERRFWEHPAMLDYLRLCEQHPDLLGINLHEYSLSSDIFYKFPWHVGRFQVLHDVCDQHGIARPKIIIGEFGWEEASNPSPAEFLDQIGQVQALYGAHPNILGAALWTLGGWHGTVVEDTIQILPVLTDLAVNYDGGEPEPPPPPPPGSHKGNCSQSASGIDARRVDRHCQRLVRFSTYHDGQP